MGACTHPHMKGLTIKRHNTTTQYIAQAIRLSPLHDTNAYLWMDAGLDTPSDLQDESHTLPAWLLPSLPEHERRQYRPDILYIPDWDHNKWNTDTVPHTLKGTTAIYLLEIGYGPDTRYLEKRAEKLQQHHQLVHLLRSEGWMVQDPYILTFGVGGTIYKDFRTTLASTFKLTHSVIDNLAHKIQRHTLEKAHQLVTTRRFLERSSTEHPQQHTRRNTDTLGTTATTRAHAPDTRTIGQQESTRPRPQGTGHSRRRSPNTRDPSISRSGGIRKRVFKGHRIRGRE
jgi:hypothetical protein